MISSMEKPLREHIRRKARRVHYFAVGTKTACSRTYRYVDNWTGIWGTKMLDVSQDWQEVTCSQCLRKRPEMAELIQFSKIQTVTAIKWLIETISELADIEDASKCVDKLSVVLAVMRKCHEAAPSLPNLPSSAVDKEIP